MSMNPEFREPNPGAVARKKWQSPIHEPLVTDEEARRHAKKNQKSAARRTRKSTQNNQNTQPTQP